MPERRAVRKGILAVEDEHVSTVEAKGIKIGRAAQRVVINEVDRRSGCRGLVYSQEGRESCSAATAATWYLRTAPKSPTLNIQ
jgi:hypothetical protein